MEDAAENVERRRRRAPGADVRELAEFVRVHGRLPVRGANDPSEAGLAKMLTDARYYARTGTLPAQKQALLDELVPGWLEVDSNQARFERRWQALLGVVQAAGTSRIPRGHVVDGRDLRRWLNSVRSDRAAGRLSAATAARFDTLPDWTWDAAEERWWCRLDRIRDRWPDRTTRFDVAWLDRQRDSSVLTALNEGQSRALASLPAQPSTPPTAGEAVERAVLRWALLAGRLNPLEADVARSRLIVDQPASLVSVGDRHGLSREAVRQAQLRLEAKAEHPVWLAPVRAALGVLGRPASQVGDDELLGAVAAARARCQPAPEAPISLSSPLARLAEHVSPRTYHALAEAGFSTVGAVCDATLAQLLQVRNLGDTSRQDLFDALDRLRLPCAAAGRGEPVTTTSPLEALRPLLRHRSFNALERGGYRTVGAVCAATERELQACRGMGTKSLADIAAVLEQLGLPAQLSATTQR